ncbi:MAG TPA: hypothetical protein VJH55_04160 [Candidatus Paceibacterota bacterium]
MRNSKLRIIANIVVFAGVFLFPWWLTFLLAVVALFNIEWYIEIIIASFLLDVLYSIPINLYWGHEFVLTLVAIIAFIVSGPIKRRLIFYT